MKIDEVVSFARATQALFDKYKAAVVAYDVSLADPWETTVLDVEILAANAVAGTSVPMGLNKGETAKRNGFMDNLTSILNDAEYKTKTCIAASTITDSLDSFGYAAFRGSIRKHDIHNFHICYEATFGQVTANHVALAAVGFVAGDVTSITANHDGAWNLNSSKIVLRQDIKDLSDANQKVFITLLESCQKVIKAVLAYAKKTKNIDLMKQASKAALLRSIRPTPVKKPRKRHIADNESVCVASKPTLDAAYEFTLLTEGGSCMVGRMNKKTGVVTAGIELKWNALARLKKPEIPGLGDCIVITNTGVVKIEVLFFVVPG